MKRKQKVVEKTEQLIEEGGKPSTQLLSQELGMHPGDIHRCLNILEKEGEIRTYSREFNGRKIRFIKLVD